MNAMTLMAHFDGKQVVLDEPVELMGGTKLLVTVLSPEVDENEGEAAWLKAAAGSEAFAFLADEAEDIYTLADGRPLNDEE